MQWVHDNANVPSWGRQCKVLPLSHGDPLRQQQQPPLRRRLLQQCPAPLAAPQPQRSLLSKANEQDANSGGGEPTNNRQGGERGE